MKMFVEETSALSDDAVFVTFPLFCSKVEGHEGGLLIPFPSKLFFSNPSSNPTVSACVAQI